MKNIKTVEFKLPEQKSEAVDWLHANNNPLGFSKEQISSDIETAIAYKKELGVNVDKVIYPYIDEKSFSEAWNDLIIELAKALRIDRLVEWFSEYLKKREERKNFKFIRKIIKRN